MQGTTADQDMRFSDKEKKIMKSTKFPANFSVKVQFKCVNMHSIIANLWQVDMKKVNMEVIQPWITKKVTDLLSLEDDVLINYIFSLLEEKVWLSGVFVDLRSLSYHTQLITSSHPLRYSSYKGAKLSPHI